MSLFSPLRTVALALATVLAVALALAAPVEAKPKKPTQKIVKRLFTEQWNTLDFYEPLRFQKIVIKPMRRRHVNELAPSDWVSPVKVVFIQTAHWSDGTQTRTKVWANALFYKEMSWYYHKKGARTKEL